MSAKVTVTAPCAGNGADHLKSRVGLDLDSQAKASALIRLYDSMAEETERMGVDAEAISSMGSFYHSSGCSDDGDGEDDDNNDGGDGGAGVGGRTRVKTKTVRCVPRAKRYVEFSPPLAPGAVRLLLFFLDRNRSGVGSGGDGDGDDGDDRGAAHLRAASDAAVAAALAELEKIDEEEKNRTRKEEEETEAEATTAAAAAAGEEVILRRRRRHHIPLSASFHVTPGRHMTVFQASHPASVVPDSTSASASGGEERGGAGNNNSSNSNNNNGVEPLLGAPPPGALEREIAAARAAALAVGAPPRLVADRVFLARSGALLLSLTEEEEEEEEEEGKEGKGEGGEKGGRGAEGKNDGKNTTTTTTTTTSNGGRVAALRREAASRMPRASERQPAILHVTLGRLLSPLPSADAARRVGAAAERAARPFLDEARARKEPWVPGALAHVVEDTFASVDGDSVLLPFRC